MLENHFSLETWPAQEISAWNGYIDTLYQYTEQNYV